MKQWRNFSALSKVKNGIDTLIADSAAIVEESLSDDSDPSLAAGRISICVEKMDQVAGVLTTLGHAEFALLATEISGLFSDSINARKAYSVEQRIEAWQLLYLTLTDFPATLEGVLSHQVSDWVDYCMLVNRIRKARNLGLAFSSSALLTNNKLHFGTLFTTMPENMIDLMSKQMDRYKQVLESFQADGNHQKLANTLHSIFSNLEVMHRDFRMGTLWGLCVGLVETLPAAEGESPNVVTLKLLQSFSTIMAQLKEHGVRVLSQSIPEKLLEPILDGIANSRISTPRLKAINLWYNLKLSLTKEYRKSNQALIINFARKGAYIKAAKFQAEDIHKLYDAINAESESRAISERQLQGYLQSLSQVRSVFGVLRMPQQAESMDKCLTLFEQHLQAGQIDDKETIEHLLAETARCLYQGEVALISRSQEFDRAIFRSSIGTGMPDVLVGAKLSLVLATLKVFDIVNLMLDNYTESNCDASLLRGIITHLEEIHAALSSIPLKRAAGFVAAALAYLNKLVGFGATKRLAVDSTLHNLAHLLLNTRSYLEQLSNDRTANHHWILDPNESFQRSMEAVTGASFLDIVPAQADMPAAVPAAVVEPEPVFEATVASGGYDTLIGEAELSFAETADDTTEIAAPSTNELPASPATTEDANAIPVLSTVVVETDEDDDLKAIFTEEAEDILRTQAGCFSSLNASLRDEEALADLRRSFHTLKGSGRMVGAKAIGELAWSAESLLNNVIAGRIALELPMLAVLRRVHDAVPQLIVDFKINKPAAFDIGSVADFIAEVNGLVQPARPAPAPAPQMQTAAPIPAALETAAVVDIQLEPALALDAPVDSHGGTVVALDYDLQPVDAVQTASVDIAEEFAPATTSNAIEPAAETEGFTLSLDSGEPAFVSLAQDISSVDAAPEATAPATMTIETAAVTEGAAAAEVAELPAVHTGVHDEEKQHDAELAHVFKGEVARQVEKMRQYLNNPHILDDNSLSITTTSFLIPVHTLHGSCRMAHFEEFRHLISPLERLLQTHPYRTMSPSLSLLLVQFCQVAEQVGDAVTDLRGFSLQDTMAEQIAHLKLMMTQAETELSGPRYADYADSLPEEHTPQDVFAENAQQEVVFDLPAAIPDQQYAAVENAYISEVMPLNALVEPFVAELAEQPVAEFSEATVAEPVVAAPVEEPLSEAEQAALVLAGFLQEATTTNALVKRCFADFSIAPDSYDRLTLLQDQLGHLEGAASLVDAVQIADMSHALAMAYQQYGRKLFRMSPAIIETLLQGHDYIGNALHALEESRYIDSPAAIMTLLQAQVDARIAEKAKDDQANSEQQVEEALLTVFLEEAGEILRELDSRVADWQQVPNDQSVTNDLLRSLHTLKGSAALVGETDISEYAHGFESFIIAATRNATACDAAFFTQVDKQLHVLQALYGLYGKTDSGGISRRNLTEQQLQALIANPDAVDSSAQPLPVADLSSQAEFATDNSSPTELAADDAAVISGSTTDESAEHTGARSAQVFYIRPDAVPEAQASGSSDAASEREVEQGPAADEQIRVSGNLLRSLLNDADEINIARNRVERNLDDVSVMLNDMDETLGRLKGYIQRFEEQARRNRSGSLANGASASGTHEGDSNRDFDTLELDRYSEFQQITLSLLEDYEDLHEIRKNVAGKLKGIEGNLKQQQRFTTRLQDGLISSQMVPFAGIVPRLRRLTRQVSTELDKQVTIKFSNPEGKIDRSILQSLLVPLEHMIRNAIDHGIETPFERLQKGKPEQGTILIKLYRQGASINLDVSDDGKGLSLDAIKRKATQLGLIREGDALSEHDAYQLIFAPGFSTASELSRISGRGVGLDVAHNEIVQIGGDIDVSSKPSEGTTFKFRLPLTASLNRALLFTLNGTQYVMLLNTIDGIMLETANNLQHYASRPEATMLHYSKKSYELAYLGALLDDSNAPVHTGGNSSVPVLLVSGQNTRMALQVDSIIGSRELVVKPLGAQFSSVAGVSGVVILGDGSVVPVLDPVALVAEYNRQHVDTSLPMTAAAPALVHEHETHGRTALVVDDSITVRKVTSAILKRSGMKVLLAKNGMEAVEVLQHTLPDVMLLDIEMPKMDGFEVASWVRRQEGALQQLPIIMITSRIGDKHRNRAQEIGVNEYMCKPFQEEKLLEAIAGLHNPATTIQHEVQLA